MSFLLQQGYIRSTNDVPSQEREAFWCDAVCQEYVKLDCNINAQRPFSGAVRGGVGLSKLRFSEVLADPQEVRRDKHLISQSTEEDFLISFQLSQEGCVRQNGREAHLKQGNFALYDSTEPYTLSFNKPFHQLIIQMPKDVLRQHLLEPERYTAVCIDGQQGIGAVLSNFILSLAQELNTVPDVCDELSDNLLNMIAMAYSSSVRVKSVVDSQQLQDTLRKKILRFIDNNLSEPELNNQKIADAQGISLRYLQKLFEGQEYSLHQIVLDKRLQKAQTLLLDKQGSVSNLEQLAYSCGFNSYAHFSRSFKKHFGLSPSELKA